MHFKVSLRLHVILEVKRLPAIPVELRFLLDDFFGIDVHILFGIEPLVPCLIACSQWTSASVSLLFSTCSLCSPCFFFSSASCLVFVSFSYLFGSESILFASESSNFFLSRT